MPNPRRSWILPALVAGAVLPACQCEVVQEPAPVTATEAAEQTPAADSPLDPTRPAFEPSQVPGPSAPSAHQAERLAEADPSERIEEMLRVANDALEDERVEAGASHCETAYASVVRMARAFARDDTGGQVPDREQFVAFCEELPADAQQCMVLSYAMSHREECTEIRDRLDPALMERARQLARGQGG